MDTRSFMPYGSQLQHRGHKHSLLEGWGWGGGLGVDFREGLFLPRAPWLGQEEGWGLGLAPRFTISAVLLLTTEGGAEVINFSPMYRYKCRDLGLHGVNLLNKHCQPFNRRQNQTKMKNKHVLKAIWDAFCRLRKGYFSGEM